MSRGRKLTIKSVREVTVMATPALLMVRATVADTSGSERSVEGRLSKHCMMTNMSSIPIPSRRKGMLGRGGVVGVVGERVV